MTLPTIELGGSRVGVVFDPLRDKSYRETGIGRDIADFIAWLELGDASPRTTDQYERDLARGALLFPSKTIDEWTDGDLAHVLNTFKKPERRVRSASYRSFFRWAKQMRRISDNPVDYLPKQKRPHQKVIEVFTPAEVTSLLSLDVADAVPMAVLLEAGLRKSEARSLQLRHCRPETQRVTVIAGKGNRDRIVPMSDNLRRGIAELALLEGLGPQDYIFYGVQANQRGKTRIRSKPIGEGTFHRWWVRCLDDAGVRYRKPHTARHTFATSWRRKGLALDEIQMLLGHASIQTTSDLYVHTRIDDVEQRMRTLEKAPLR